MLPAPLPPNEIERIRALHDLGILDTEPEFHYDEITELAAQICETPISLVSLLDKDRQWFKSRHGLDAQQSPRDIAFCAHTILGGNPFEVEDSRLDPRFQDNPAVTGAVPVIFYAGFPLDLGNGLNVGTLCVIDQKPKRLTDKQRRAMRCLASQVVAQLQLRRANRDLQKALIAKSSFLASMSHEIRTPMNGIVGITNMLIDKTRDRETLDHLRIIRNCSDILVTLLNDILDFSKLESGKIRFESHAFSLEELTRNLLEILGPVAQGKGLRMKLGLGGKPDWLIGDSTRLSQILLNLLGNAIKFTEAGEVSLNVAKRPADAGRIALTFTVRDDGIGIPKPAQEKLFSSFHQADISTTRKFGGTGLGLVIVKGLVEGMGGTITLESEPGKGSTFGFTLEYEVGESPASFLAMPGEGSAGLLSDIKPLAILIAEDNRVNQIVALAAVRKLGYSADLAANGVEVLRMLETKEYDLILMDCQMPVMDGFEATERIVKKYPPEKRPIIYAFTAAVTEEERARCMASGMSLVLAKPFSPNALRQALQDLPEYKTSLPA
ncbi:MAG: ATP-binding protein [Fibrobacteria bacterium]